MATVGGVIGNLVVRLAMDSRDYNSGIHAATRQANNLNRTLRSNINQLEKGIGASAAKIGSALLGMLGGPGGAGVSGAAAGAVAALGTVATAVAALIGIAVAAGTAVVGALAAITAAAYKMAESAVPIDGIRRAFESLTTSFGIGASRMLADLQEASAGMIRFDQLMRTFNLSAQLVSVQFATELPEALQYLTKVSLATGLSMDYLTDSLVRGIGRLSIRILDNLGVTISLEEAYAKWAAE